MKPEKTGMRGFPFLPCEIWNRSRLSLAQLNLVGRNMRGSIKVLKELFIFSSSPKSNMLDFISQCKEWLHHAISLAKEALSSSQENIKVVWQKSSWVTISDWWSSFGLLSMLGSAFTAHFSGLCRVKCKLIDTDYLIHTAELGFIYPFQGSHTGKAGKKPRLLALGRPLLP